jgi:hypothetical protein
MSARRKPKLVVVPPRVRSVREAYTKCVLGEWPEELTGLFAWLEDQGVSDIDDACTGSYEINNLDEHDKVEDLEEEAKDLAESLVDERDELNKARRLIEDLRAKVSS